MIKKKIRILYLLLISHHAKSVMAFLFSFFRVMENHRVPCLLLGPSLARDGFSALGDYPRFTL